MGDMLLDNLLVADLVRYRKTCKHAKATVDSYIRRKYKLQALLSRWFTEQQTLELRRLMSDTGMFISGSVALQFFDRVVYPSSDLDLYLPHPSAERVVNWLCSLGYKVVPHKHLTLKAQLGIEEDECARDDEYDGFSHKPKKGYHSAAIVINLARGDARIQLMTSFRCPLEIIMGYHSTFVMNIITHERAYCLYPLATLHERRGIWLLDQNQHIKKPPRNPHEREAWMKRNTNDQKALSKYIARGFTLVYQLTSAEYMDSRSSLRRGPRYIGDDQCWVLPIHPILDLPKNSTIEMNSFSLSYSEYGQKPYSPSFSYEHFSASGLSAQILLADTGETLWVPDDGTYDYFWWSDNERPSEAEFVKKELVEGLEGLVEDQSYRWGQEKKDKTDGRHDAKFMSILSKFRRGEKIVESDIYLEEDENEEEDSEEETEDESGEDSNNNSSGETESCSDESDSH